MSDPLNLTTATINAHANGHKQIFRQFARALSPALFYDYQKIYDHLEPLKSDGTAAIGNGVMIFHRWVDDWPESSISLLKLKTPFQALNTPDRRPVDLVLLLISPKSDGPVHLGRLSKITRFMRDPHHCDMLRGATSKSAAIAVFDEINHQNKEAA